METPATFLWVVLIASSQVYPANGDLSLRKNYLAMLPTCYGNSCPKSINNKDNIQTIDSSMIFLHSKETRQNNISNSEGGHETFSSSTKQHSNSHLNPETTLASSAHILSDGTPVILHRTDSQHGNSIKINEIERSSALFTRNLQETLMEESLQRLLRAVIRKHLQNCDLILVAGGAFQRSRIVGNLLHTSNLKQVVYMEFPEDLAYQVVWKSPRCQGTLILMTDPTSLLAFGNQNPFLWDYNARVIIAGLSKSSLEEFINTKKGRKTEHLVGVIKGNKEGRYKIYRNQLFWGKGFKKISTWRGQNFSRSEDFFPDKISNLRKGVIRVLIFEWQPAIIFHRDANGTITLRYGRDTALVRALSDALNFTIYFKDIPNGENFGVLLPNGSYNGMVGLLGSHGGDIAIANLYISAIGGRDKFQEYSTAYAEDQSCCLARIDPPLPQWQSPILPFQVTTWVAVFIGILLAGPVLYLLGAIGRMIGLEGLQFRSLLVTSLYTYGVHFSHPMAALPKSSSLKLFVAFLWIYSIILTTGYRSNLTAFLTITLQPASIETFKDLYNSGLKVLGIPFFKTSLEGSQNAYLRALANNYEVKMNFIETKKDVLSGRSVTINSRIYLEAIGAQTTKPSGEPLFRIMKECFSSYAVGIAYPRNSPLKSKFDMAILRIFESGLVRRWRFESVNLYQKLREQSGEQLHQFQSEEEDSGGAPPLSLEHVQGVFAVLVLGYITASILFAIEVCSK